MTQFILTEATLGQLPQLTHPVELCDAGGRVLGRFVPVLDPALYEGLEPQVSREELQRRKQHKGKSYTTAEVLAHLENL